MKKYYKALWSTLPFKNSDELNILANTMENHLGLCYTTHLIHCRRRNEGFNLVCKPTVNLAFLRLQRKRAKIQRIQQDTKSEGKWKELIRLQGKQWLIMINLLPDDNE